MNECIIKAVLLGAMALMMSGCGFKGPLIMPQRNSNSKPLINASGANVTNVSKANTSDVKIDDGTVKINSSAAIPKAVASATY